MNTPPTGELVPVRYTGGSFNGRSFDTQPSELRPGQLTVSRSGVDEVYTYEVFEEHTQ